MKNNTDVMILFKAKDVQRFFPFETEQFCWKLLRIIKDSKNKKIVTAEDFIEYCNEVYDWSLTKEKVIEILK